MIDFTDLPTYAAVVLGLLLIPGPAALVGSLVVCICNLGPKNIAGFTSELLILGARDTSGEVIVLGPRSAVAIGEPIF